MQDIIKRPLINEKLSALQEKGVYGFEVNKTSNKIEIAKAVEKMFSVNVRKVNTLIVRGKSKSRMQGGRAMTGMTQTYKKAMVYLAEGESIDFYANL